MGNVTKVMKFELRYIDGFQSFYDMQKHVWQMQQQVREVMNKTIQEAYGWDNKNRSHYEETGEWLDVKKETGYKSLDGYVYNVLSGRYCDMAAANLNAAIQKAWKKYKGAKKDVMSGKISLPSYKSDQPIPINKKNIRIREVDGVKIAELTLLSLKAKKEYAIVNNVRFEVKSGDGTQRKICQNVLDGVYAIGESQLVYDKKKWFLLLTYSFLPEKTELDPDKILGVDLGEAYALYASSIGEYGSFKIEGGEITDFAKQLERRKRSLQQQARYCGEGRIGHGTKTRVAKVYDAEDRIANFRSTVNHRYSKALVEYATKNGYGTIQMEDLTNIKKDTGFPKRLQHWTYYDLQSKIETKAEEKGIKVVKIDPRYTSQRCSKCGCIDPANRPTQERFCCVSCGFKSNADLNASLNISIQGIEKIIEKTVREKEHQETEGAKREHT